MFSTPLVYVSFFLTNAIAGTSGSSKDKVQYNCMVVTDFTKNPFPSFECGKQ